jgi:serine protease Do
VAIGRLVEDAKPAPKAGVRVPPKSRSKGKGKDKGTEIAPPAPGGRSLIGLVLAPLSDELRTKHGLNQSAKGVIVLEVDPASPAADRNVRPGDVIVEVSHETVGSIEDIVKGVESVRSAGRNAVLLRLENARGDLRFVAVPVHQ